MEVSRVHGDRRICIVDKYTPGDAWGRVLCSQEMGEVNGNKGRCQIERCGSITGLDGFGSLVSCEDLM